MKPVYRTEDRGHHESDREVAERRSQMTPSNPSDASEEKAVVSVSIPVTIGGYTGQRDQWESLSRKMEVTLDGSNIVLREVGGVGRLVIIPRHGLESAIAVLGTLA